MVHSRSGPPIRSPTDPLISVVVMPVIFEQESRTFSEYLLVPNLTP